MKIYHNSHDTEYREPFGAVSVGGWIRLKVKLMRDSTDISVMSVKLMLRRDGAEPGVLHMTDEIGGFYSVKFRAPVRPCILWYYFAIDIEQDGELRTLYYGNNHMQLGGEGCLYDSSEEDGCNTPEYQITIYRESKTPEWYRNAIMYQIFPDRFARDGMWEKRCRNAISLRENASGQKQFVEQDWNKPAYYVRDEAGNVTAWPFYGGSLAGIESRLDYLAALGVSVIYLNPIFRAVSNHRYDTADYLSIDPMLGTEEDFRRLCKAAGSKGIRIILDGVFGYTGADSVYFDKFGNYGDRGAYGDPNSRYRYWYSFGNGTGHVTDGRNAYKCHRGMSELPEVDENNLLYRQLICGSNGVLVKWMRAGASGWRINEADGLPDDFIKVVRQRIRNESEDAVVLGDVRDDASRCTGCGPAREFLLGSEFDSTTNYAMRDILLAYMNYECSAPQALSYIMSIKENYPPEQFNSALGMLGTHNQTRILTILGADYDYNTATSKLKMLATLQYTLPGIPCIYYGDEIGMTGDVDPANRNGFAWGEENPNICKHYVQLGKYYNEHSVLRTGEFIPVMGETEESDDVLAFIRRNEEESVLVLANRSYDTRTIEYNRKEYTLDKLSCVIRSI